MTGPNQAAIRSITPRPEEAVLPGIAPETRERLQQERVAQDALKSLSEMRSRSEWQHGDYPLLRQTLDTVATLKAEHLSPDLRKQLVTEAAAVTSELTNRRFNPTGQAGSYVVWVPAGFSGGPNPILQEDLRQTANDISRLKTIGALDGASAQALVEGTRQSLSETVADYRAFIQTTYGLSEQTAQVFGATSQALAVQTSPTSAGLTAAVSLREQTSQDPAVQPAEQAQTQRAPATTAQQTYQQLCEAIIGEDKRFRIRGTHDGVGPNPQLQADVRLYAEYAREFFKDGQNADKGEALVGHLIKYHSFVASTVQITPETQAVFEETLGAIVSSSSSLAKYRGRSLQEVAAALALQPSANPPAQPQPEQSQPGQSQSTQSGAAAPDPSANPYLVNVASQLNFTDKEFESQVEASISRVQPACVLVRVHGGQGSGVNLTPDGQIVTNAHVVPTVGQATTVTFPDGRVFNAVATYVDSGKDLTLLRISGAANLPTAPVAAQTPGNGTPIVIIGQPGGEYGNTPWYVSSGQIIQQHQVHPIAGIMGGTQHSAWTYWGHSGSPMFNYGGEIVGLHNSVDTLNGNRHGIPLWSLRQFLEESGMLSAAARITSR